MGTRQNRVMLAESIATRASAYGIPGVSVDGTDVLRVYEAARAAVQRARRGEGPTLIECRTYRHMGHSRIDPATYRPREEVEEWLRRDPIQRLRRGLIEGGHLSDAEVQALERAVAKNVESAVEFAMESPYPSSEEALDDLYA